MQCKYTKYICKDFIQGYKFCCISAIIFAYKIPVVNLSPVSTTPALLVAKFATIVVDTGGKFAASVTDTGGAS